MSFENDNFPSAESANLLVKSALEKKRLENIDKENKKASVEFNICKQQIINNSENGSFRTHCSHNLLKEHLDYFRSKGYTVEKNKTSVEGIYEIFNVISCKPN